MARYRNGVLLSYSLVAYAPWEGMRVAITGTRGRVEMDVVENITHLQNDDEAGVNASTGSFKSAHVHVYPMFGLPYDIEIPAGTGGHGDADPLLLEQLFSPDPPADPFLRAASHIDGAVSLLVGIAANESIQTGKVVAIDDLFVLPENVLAQASGQEAAMAQHRVKSK